MAAAMQSRAGPSVKSAAAAVGQAAAAAGGSGGGGNRAVVLMTSVPKDMPQVSGGFLWHSSRLLFVFVDLFCDNVPYTDGDDLV